MIYTQEKPKIPGYYLWKENEDDTPFHVLAYVKFENNELLINLRMDIAFCEFYLMKNTRDRWWCKVE